MLGVLRACDNGTCLVREGRESFSEEGMFELRLDRRAQVSTRFSLTSIMSLYLPTVVIKVLGKKAGSSMEG